MSENVELIRRAFRDWQEREFEGLRGYLDPDFEFHEDPRFPESGVYRGRDAFERYAQQFFAAWETHDWQLEEVIPAGRDTVLTMFRTKWRGGGSGVELEISPGWLWMIRDGKAVRCKAFLDRADALDAAGLSE